MISAEQAPTIRILLADDHTVLRAGTRRILEDERDMLVVGEAGDGEEAVALANQLRPDVILLDIAMPTMDGVKACGLLQQAVPDMRIIVLTGHDNIAYIRALNKLGVDGYLLKSADPRELIQAIRQVMSRRTSVVMSPEIAEKLANTHDTASLTAKELEVLRAIAQGMKNREIAEAQSLSINTVEFHMRNILAKLEVPTRAAAILRAQELGLLPTPDNT
ncbi:MAG TPA: response regulator transcription factor [Ktedonobacterales bacterium]|nr:response regulator transcription factor [Ktedonobacterales bacterium]